MALRPHTGLRSRGAGQCYGGNPHKRDELFGRDHGDSAPLRQQGRHERRGWMDGGSSARRRSISGRVELTKGGRGVRPPTRLGGGGGGWCPLAPPLPLCPKARTSARLCWLPRGQLERWEDGWWEGQRQSLPASERGKPWEVWDLARWRGWHLHTHPVIGRRYPSREGIRFATGRTCWCWGTGRRIRFN